MPGAPCLFVFITGELCAKYDLIAKIRDKKYCIIVFLVGLFIRLLYTNSNGLLMFDLICVPAMVPFVLNLISENPLGTVLHQIGRHSTTMWLTHSFIYVEREWIKVIPTATLGMPVILLLSYVLAFLWDTLYKTLSKKLFIRERNYEGKFNS